MASPMRTSSECKAIPRRVLISDPTDIPCSYSSTPGGTLYSTTPGGTKIVYERSFLMNMRNSPLSKTPPSWEIPDNLIKGSPNGPTKKPKKVHNRCPITKRNGLKGSIDDDEQFQLEL